jgi:hypothetical protein
LPRQVCLLLSTSTFSEHAAGFNPTHDTAPHAHSRPDENICRESRFYCWGRPDFDNIIVPHPGAAKTTTPTPRMSVLVTHPLQSALISSITINSCGILLAAAGKGKPAQRNSASRHLGVFSLLT